MLWIMTRVIPGVPPATSCPKLLMFDGLGYRPADYSEADAKYWGRVIGVQGFFLNYVMGGWGNSVGDDESSPLYQRLKVFQETFSKYGVTDNFIKVASRLSLDWSNPKAQAQVVSNFRQAAHLARYAGLKGLALDLEPQAEGLWFEDSKLPDKSDRVFRFGRQVGEAIHATFPDATIIVLPEVLMYSSAADEYGTSRNYALSPRFWDGLSQSHFHKLIIATELTYNSWRPDQIARNIREKYQENLIQNSLDPDSVPLAPGIWPLGKTYTDKAPRISTSQFKDRLGRAYQEARHEGSPYVWIYGFGSAWQTDGPYGKGNVTPQFGEYVDVLKQMEKSCSN
jgi:hypothetical protein